MLILLPISFIFTFHIPRHLFLQSYLWIMKVLVDSFYSFYPPPSSPTLLFPIFLVFGYTNSHRANCLFSFQNRSYFTYSQTYSTWRFAFISLLISVHPILIDYPLPQTYRLSANLLPLFMIFNIPRI